MLTLRPFVITEKCHYCQKGRNPRDIEHLPGGVKMCGECRVQHNAGVLAMSGLKANGDGTFSTVAPPPPECSECHLSVQELLLRAGGENLPMAVHHEHGVYRFLCADCNAVYVRKRRDLYGDTQFGYEQGLK